MARLDTSNVLATYKGGGHMFSIKGKASTGGADKAVQNGYVGKIGELITSDVYEFLQLADGDKEVYVVATPEVNAKDDSITDRMIRDFRMVAGQVADAIPVVKHDKITISEDGIEGLPASGDLVGKYVYAVGGKDTLVYKATKPVEVDKAILVGKIERVENATQGMVVGLANKQLQLNYRLVKIKFI